LQPKLKHYQEMKTPSFIQQQTRQKLEADGVVLEPAVKKRRSQEVIPLSKPSSGVSKLPELPDDLKLKQVRGNYRLVANSDTGVQGGSAGISLTRAELTVGQWVIMVMCPTATGTVTTTTTTTATVTTTTTTSGGSS